MIVEIFPVLFGVALDEAHLKRDLIRETRHVSHSPAYFPLDLISGLEHLHLEVV